jgi:[acyl-carrier-protein] S-malonyltransferase
MKAAIIFPGQGSQFVGMGKDLARQFQVAERLFEEADETLGFSLSRICFEGDKDILTETRNAQPAILLHSIAVWKILKEEAGIETVITAGHSLGEYSALVAAGAIGAMDALKIVRRRGELMYEAGLRQPGTMAAIIGMEKTDVKEICENSSRDNSIVVLANINCPGQIVISGHIDAVHRAMEMAKGKGVKKAIQLNVSGAFHSPLVSSAEDDLVLYIKGFKIRGTEIDVISNADAGVVNSKEEIVGALSKQLTNPVLWSDSMELLLKRWDGRIIEAGPGKVLTGLMKRIDHRREVIRAGTAEEIKKIVASEVDFV